MFATVPRLTQRHFFAAILALVAVGMALSFTPEYRPLGERMAQRYAENLDRAAAEVKAREAQTVAEQRQREEAARQAEQQRAAADTRARDEARTAVERQRAAEEEKQRAATSFDSLVAEFLRILRTRRPPVVAMAGNATKALEQLASTARQTDFYTSAGIDPAQTILACTDPATTRDMLNREARRDRNILACTVHMALHRAENPEPAPQVMVALLHRIGSDEEAGHFPLQTLVAYVWLPHLYAAAVAGQPPGPFPDLNSGEAINPALLRGAVPPSFAHRLIETGTTEEKLELVTHAYPDLRRMAELGARIASACQMMKRSPCLTPN